MKSMTIREWVNLAPDGIRAALQSVPVMNFLREHQNQTFQMIGSYDGAMSEECKESFRKDFEALSEFLDALKCSDSSPAP